MTGVNKSKFVLLAGLLIALTDVVAAKPWRGIVPLHSTRSEVRKLLGKPIIGGDGVIDLYETKEGRVHVMYARAPCEEGLPADWGNWRVKRDTVVNVSVQLHDEIPLKALRIRNLKKYKWYTGDSGATYYRDPFRGLDIRFRKEWSLQSPTVRGRRTGP